MTPTRLFTISLIAIVFFLATLSLLPHGIRYYILHAQGETYAPMPCYDVDILNTYAPRYRDAIDGRLIAGEIDTYEHKDGPALWSMLPPLILAPFFIPFGSVPPGLIVTDVVFILFTFFSFFLLFVALTKNRFFALFFSFWLMVYAGIVLYIPPITIMELKVLILRFFPFLVEKVPIGLKFRGRESFIPAAPFFILSLYFAYWAASAMAQKATSFLSDMSTRRDTGLLRLGSLGVRFLNGFPFTAVQKTWPAIVAGIFYGLLFYIYFYYWAFTTVFLGIFFLALLIMKETRAARAIFIAGIVGLVVSIPFWINQIELAQLPQYQEIMDRVAGYEIGDGFRFYLWPRYLTYVVMSLLAFWLGKKLNAPIKASFLTALALAGIVVLNVQVVTGFNIQTDHWFTRVFVIAHNIVWASIAYDAFLYFKPRIWPWISRHKKAIATLFFIAVFYFSASFVYNQIVSVSKRAPKCVMPASLIEGYEWLNKNTPKDSVVMTPSFKTNAEIPVYTHNRIFLARSHNSLASDEEIFDRLYITYKMLGISTAYLYDMLQTFDGMFNLVNFKYNHRYLDTYYGGVYPDPPIPKAEMEKILNTYTFFKLPRKLPYRLDYIFIGPREREIGINEATLQDAEKVYNSLGVTIYRLKK